MPNIARSRRQVRGWGGIALAAILGVAALSAPALAKPKPAPAKAKPAGKRIAVLPPTDGTAKDAVVTAKIVKALQQHKIVAISGAPAKKAIETGGVPSSDADWTALARRLKVDGVIESTVTQTGGKRSIDVAIHNGADGGVAGRETFAAKGPPAKLAVVVAGGFWKKLGAALKETAPPKKDEAGAGPAVPAQSPSEGAPAAGKTEEAESPAKEAEAVPLPEPAAEEKKGKAAPAKAKEAPEEASEEEGEENEEAEEAPPGSAVSKRGKGKASRKPRTLEIEIGGRALQHLFEYLPASAGKSLVAHFLPVFQGHVAWFPITYAGIFVAGEYNPLLATNSYPTATRELIIGAQGRYPLSFGSLGLSAAYFQHLFVIRDTSSSSDPARSSLVWPDLAYQGARFAANGRFNLGDLFKVGIEAAYRMVTSPGEGSNYIRSSYYFPNGKANFGLEGSAFVGVGVLPWLELHLGVDYRRYTFGVLQPGPDNANGTNATGATDQYLGFSLGAVGVFGGK